jgi:hypothetical protein
MNPLEPSGCLRLGMRKAVQFLAKTTRQIPVIVSVGCLFCALADRVNAFTYSLDDGTAETAVGLTLNNDLIALNSFITIPGTTIDTISIAFGFGPNAGTLNGTPFQAVLWNDPNGDGNPSDATVLATANGFVAGAGTNTFVPLSISPTVVTTPNFFVGFILTQPSGTFPGALDQTPPTFANRSFVAANAAGMGNIFDLTANSFVPLTTIEGAGISGNWLIRAGAEVTQRVGDSGRSGLLFGLAILSVIFLRLFFQLTPAARSCSNSERP